MAKCDQESIEEVESEYEDMELEHGELIILNHILKLKIYTQNIELQNLENRLTIAKMHKDLLKLTIKIDRFILNETDTEAQEPTPTLH